MSHRIPVLVEVILLNLLVVLDGHCCGCLVEQLDLFEGVRNAGGFVDVPFGGPVS